MGTVDACLKIEFRELIMIYYPEKDYSFASYEAIDVTMTVAQLSLDRSENAV
ncbi:hypothetical protein [Leptolyngbya sp. 'hensonii']|uniref:hypothetical protein n=1 Tax=Leptolyngbya sp. 'hensonii' TaxID=1922337 RepID=UPI000AD33E73|nr:hypothetical protein [Leptolyngbya sp. 'hensonii']